MKKMMFFAILSTFSSAIAASEGLHVTYGIDFFDREPSQHTTSQYLIQPGAVRMEIEGKGSPLGTTVVIKKQTPKLSVILFPDKKIYYDVTSHTNEKSAAKIPSQNQTPFQETGKKKTIAGYACAVLSRDFKDRREEACTSNEFSKEFEALETALAGDNQKDMLPKGLKGLPLEYRVIKKKSASAEKIDMILVAEKLSRESFTPSTFDVPADYEKKSLELKTGKGAEVPQSLEQKLQEMKKLMEQNQNPPMRKRK